MRATERERRLQAQQRRPGWLSGLLSTAFWLLQVSTVYVLVQLARVVGDGDAFCFQASVVALGLLLVVLCIGFLNLLVLGAPALPAAIGAAHWIVLLAAVLVCPSRTAMAVLLWFLAALQLVAPLLPERRRRTVHHQLG